MKEDAVVPPSSPPLVARQSFSFRGQKSRRVHPSPQSPKPGPGRRTTGLQKFIVRSLKSKPVGRTFEDLAAAPQIRRQSSAQLSSATSKATGKSVVSRFLAARSKRQKSSHGGRGDAKGPLPVASEKTVDFPEQTNRWKVLSPEGPKRFTWDMYMLLCTLWIMIATPFELTFLGGEPKCFSLKDPYGVVTHFVNLSFAIDLCLQFNTAYFDQELGEWELRRSRIVSRYLLTWFPIDGASILPTECMNYQGATLRYARLVRSMRFFKLLKVFKSPRIISAAARHLDISSKVQTVAKYLAMLLFTVHWSACVLRLLTLIACDQDNGPYHRQGHAVDDDLFDDGCPLTVLTRSRNWGDGVFAVYATAALWSLIALNGEATAVLHSEAVLGICIMLLGFLMMGFLLGELTHTFQNFDPVGNKFKMIKDHLGEFMNRYNFSRELKSKLREYISLSEHSFRVAHYGELLASLSPQFRLICTNQVYGPSVASIPFMRYVVQHAHGIHAGTDIYVFPSSATPPPPPAPRPSTDSRPSGEGRSYRGWSSLLSSASSVTTHEDPPPPRQPPARENRSRRARVLGIPSYLSYDVAYYLEDDDDELGDGAAYGDTEWRVCHSRVDIERSVGQDARIMRNIFRVQCERDSLVAKIAQIFESRLSMPRDTVVKRDVSTNDALFLVESGAVVIFGRDSVKPYKSTILGPGHYFGDEISSLLIGSGQKRLMHYSVKTLGVTHFTSVDGDGLVHILTSTPSFPNHRVHIKRYGAWCLLKAAMIRRFRERRLQPPSADTITDGFDSIIPEAPTDDRHHNEEVDAYLARWFVDRSTRPKAERAGISPRIADLRDTLYAALLQEQRSGELQDPMM